jgi:hypothetical protein
MKFSSTELNPFIKYSLRASYRETAIEGCCLRETIIRRPILLEDICQEISIAREQKELQLIKNK